MAATRIDRPRQPSREWLLESLRYPDRGNTVMPSMTHERARYVVRDVLVTGLGPQDLVAVELTLYPWHGNAQTFLIPDVLVRLGAGQLDGATGDLRTSYRMWDDGPPDLVIELASPGTVVRDNLGKKEDYAAYGVREYVQFDPLKPGDPKGPLLVPTLQVWRLVAGTYLPVAEAPGGGIPSTVLQGLEWVQAGQLLRLRATATGALLPTATEKEAAGRRLAEAKQRRADAARLRADATAAAEAARADAADAELARLRAEIARLREARS